jgi:hypothetical protein
MLKLAHLFQYFSIISTCCFLLSCENENNAKTIDLVSAAEIDSDEHLHDFLKIRKKANEALGFVKANGMNSERFILIDMSRHSGLERCYVWNAKRDTVEQSYMVSHGCCDQPWGIDRTKKNPTFSNIPESHCSSLGKYKLGERGYSNWGVHLKYLMHGLDPTNSNAFSRVIVFHSWEAVPDEELYPDGTPEGWGCPAVSNAAFREIDEWLQKAEEPVLMWIYK